MSDPFWIVIERLQAELEVLRNRDRDPEPPDTMIDVLITFPDGKRYGMTAKVHPEMPVALMLHHLAEKAGADLPHPVKEDPTGG